jgi:hypothetical protein
MSRNPQQKLKKVATAVAAALGLACSAGAWAADNVSQTVTLEVQAVNEISVSSPTLSLIISSGTAGSSTLTSATNTATTYNITTNETNKKIVAKINSAPPAGVTLTTTLAAGGGAAGTSAGPVSLSSTDQNVVTGITQSASSGNQISYSLSATLAAGVVPSTTRVVTFTIVAGS